MFVLDSHEELHKSNVLVQPFNGRHLVIRKREVEDLQCLLHNVIHCALQYTYVLLF